MTQVLDSLGWPLIVIILVGIGICVGFGLGVSFESWSLQELCK
jgi:hypothetical protein